ncbi:DNA polymerase III subunit gamma/tau [Vampirovibrio sp.]|uniref:DNA polymerase III subunit gamma/tau n=1 Tax=Vampirovibrio sp. TaxID=2717857 RepID=UPI003593F105
MTIESMETRSQTRIETYIPLYRKYRPQLFADLVGQEAISQTLGNAIALNKVAHAYLFCGPRGTGKTSTARIFAKSLNCEQGPTASPCLQCASCTGIAQGNALDVIEFDAASNNGVGDARELIENCQYSSMTGRFKVYIIDEVHMLTSQAFNALLKTLEEPPANVIFIFATTEAHKVLPTIISRCQRFDFNRITTENIVGRLRYIAQQEAIGIDEEALLMIGRHARGGLRDAVGLLDQVSVLSRAQADKLIGRQDVALFIGTLEEDLLLRLSGAIAERRAADLLNELNELLNRGIEPIQLLKDLTLHFRNLLLVQAVGANANPDLLSLPPDYFKRLAEQSALFPEMEEIPQIIGRLSFVERNVRNSSQPQLWLEVGLIELAYRHDIQLVKELSERVARLEQQLAGAPVVSKPLSATSAPVKSAPAKPQASPPLAQPQARPSAPAMMPPQPPAAMAVPSAPVATPAVSSMPEPVGKVMQAMPVADSASSPAPPSGSVEAIYAQVCAAIPSLMFRALIQQQTFPISQEGDLLVVGCVGDPNFTTLKKPEKFIHLQKAVDKAFGRPMRIEVTLEKKKPTGHGEATSVAASNAASSPPAPAPVMPVAPAKPEVVVVAPVPTAPPLPAMAVEKPAPAFGPAMPEGFVPVPVKPLNPSLNTAPVNSAPPSADDMPPMDIDNPPPGLEEEDEEEMGLSNPVAMSRTSLSISTSLGDHELSEAKKHALELLQGRILE